ncbi:unnamed protein product [Linum trigynum]|uniref:Endonuclease/exonuclease/phosphatase domain-containing protein n=2 Tax=Linum trigynum TaxID=586398 RepID=A0AAV2D6P2_9ROSI
METKQTVDENKELRELCGFKNGDCWPATVTTRNKAGGISIWWGEDLMITRVDFSLNFVDVAVQEEDGARWRFTVIYGWPKGTEKWMTWDLLRRIGQQWDGPWLCGGDFNQVRSTDEKSGGRCAHEPEMNHFGDCLTDIGLQDLGFHGYPYTWENRRHTNGFIEERLDRFVANDSWRDLFPNNYVQHWDRANSDHRPIICDTRGSEDVEVRWGRAFRFEPH